MVQAADLAIHMNGHPVLTNVNLRVAKGEFVYLIGRTGAGKSSFLRTLYADLKLAAGKLRVAEYNLNALKTSDVPYLRRRLGIVFQDFQLLPDRTVGDNIAFVMRSTGWRDKSKIKQRTTEVLMQVGLAHKLNAMPHQLSGGEQQRTVIARALVNDPRLLIADEPTGNLDPEVTEHVMDILHGINRQGVTVMMATHEHDLLRRYQGRMLEIKDGTIAEMASPPGTASPSF